MSVSVSNSVWEHSKHVGTELLMLLAIADHADARGVSWPSVPTLAKRCRMSDRNANHLLAKLAVSGELEILRNAGPRGTNLYRITLTKGKGVKEASPPVDRKPLKPTSPPAPEAGFTPEAAFTLKPVAGGGEAGSSKPLKPTSPEPSLNRQEPSSTSLDQPATSKTPSCPIKEIVELYHQNLPDLPRARLMTSKRERALRQRWAWVLSSTKGDGSRRATTADQAITWFEGFFRRASDNDFLMGRTPRSGEHANWRCDLDFLLTDRGLTHVIEKTLEAA